MDTIEIDAVTRGGGLTQLRQAARRGTQAGVRFGLTAIAGLWLVGRCISPYELAGDGWLFKLATVAALARTLAMHGAVGSLILAVVAWMVRCRRTAAMAVALALIGVAPQLYALRPRTAPQVAPPSLRVMTCNLFRPNRQVAEMAEEVLAADADIVCFQEYAQHWHAGLRDRLGERYPYWEYTQRRYDMGLAVYSKQPLRGDIEAGDFGDDPPAPPTRVEIDLGDRRVALYNLHMFQPWPARNMQFRRAQFRGVLDRLRRERLPVIIAGDLNGTTTGWVHAELTRRGLSDAHQLAGWGIGSTWPNLTWLRHLPGITIDHIYVGPELTCTASTVGSGPGSDHRPVVATVAFKSPASPTGENAGP
jgi:endonuclease/exonuclease/phosphatase (EEP) superfamily protein YafD